MVKWAKTMHMHKIYETIISVKNCYFIRYECYFIGMQHKDRSLWFTVPCQWNSINDNMTLALPFWSYVRARVSVSLVLLIALSLTHVCFFDLCCASHVVNTTWAHSPFPCVFICWLLMESTFSLLVTRCAIEIKLLFLFLKQSADAGVFLKSRRMVALLREDLV